MNDYRSNLSSSRYESVNSQRQRDKQRLTDLEKNITDEKQQKQRFELQIKTEKTLTKKLQDDLTKITAAPVRLVSRLPNDHLFDARFRNECAEQCLKRRRDQENELREMRKILNDKDDRIKLLDSDVKVSDGYLPKDEVSFISRWQVLLKYRESQADTEALYQHLTQIQERNTQLQDSLSAETRIKLDLFSALGEVKRQLEIANGKSTECKNGKEDC